MLGLIGKSQVVFNELKVALTSSHSGITQRNPFGSRPTIQN